MIVGLVAAGLLAIGLVIVAAAKGLDALGAWHGRRQAEQLLTADTAPHRIVVDDRRADAGPPPGTAERRRVDLGPGGRHRREDVTGELSATSILRRLNAGDSPDTALGR